jgi:hypothetical protein
MNRKERRLTSKRLGILQYQQKLPLAKKLNLMYENIIIGKQMEKENAEAVRQSVNSQMEEIESRAVYHLAEDIAKVKKIPVLDAMSQAQKEIDTRKK